MEITAVKTYIIPPEVSETPWSRGATWVLVKLETDEGIDGWGEAYASSDGGQATATEIHGLFSIIDGLDPFRIRQFVNAARGEAIGSSGGREVSSAAAGIEIAMWDIVGKALDLPVHKLLGGPCRDRIAVYGNCWSDTKKSPDELAVFAGTQVDQGFKTVKIYPFLYDTTVEEGIACLQAVRNRVGPNVAISIDMWSRMRLEDQSQIAEALHADGVTWFEDPAPATDVDTLSRIRKETGLPIVTGETLYSKQDFHCLLQKDAIDILNPEISICGILGIMELAAMAEPFGAKVSVHDDNSMNLGLAVGLQAAAIVPNFTMVEHFPRFIEGSNTFSSFDYALDEDGCIPLSNEPGFGVTMDEAALAPMRYKPTAL